MVTGLVLTSVLMAIAYVFGCAQPTWISGKNAALHAVLMSAVVIVADIPLAHAIF